MSLAASINLRGHEGLLTMKGGGGGGSRFHLFGSKEWDIPEILIASLRLIETGNTVVFYCPRPEDREVGLSVCVLCFTGWAFETVSKDFLDL